MTHGLIISVYGNEMLLLLEYSYDKMMVFLVENPHV